MRAELPTITVINTPDLVYEDYHYIGRGSPLANDGKSIDEYADWLYSKIADANPEVEDLLNNIAQMALAEGKAILRCYCTEHQCHGTIVRDVVLQAIKEHST